MKIEELNETIQLDKDLFNVTCSYCKDKFNVTYTSSTTTFTRALRLVQEFRRQFKEDLAAVKTKPKEENVSPD
jgi:predicted Rdx family selenoprotein